MEIIYNGNIVPLSKWMFDSEVKCGHCLERNCESIRNQTINDRRLPLIDAYVINNNDEVKAYVEAREANFRKASFLRK